MGNACVTEGLTLSFQRVEAPSPTHGREGHVLASTAGGRLVVFGGSEEGPCGDEVRVSEEKGWSVIGRSPCRVGASSASVEESVFVFGGVDPAQGCWLNDVLVIDTTRGGVVTTVHGSIAAGPSPRDKAAAVAAGRNLLVFGGFGPSVDGGNDEDDEDEDEDDEDEDDEGIDPAKFQWFNDLYVFNLQAGAWRSVPTSNAPPPRAATAACVSVGRLWVFGGKTKNGREADLWSVPLADVLTVGGAAPATWTLHAPKGVAPPGRSFHALLPVPGSSRMVAIGGVDNNDQRLADVHVFDPELDAWAQPSYCQGVPQEFAGAAVTAGDALVLHGLGDVFVAAALAPVRTAKIGLPPAPQ